jgi:hypothetical protein
MAPRKIGRSTDSDTPTVETAAVRPSNVTVVADVAAPSAAVAPPPLAPDPAPAPTPAPVVPTAPAPPTTQPTVATTTTTQVAARPANAPPSIVSPKAVHKLAGDAPQIILDHYDGDDLPATVTAKLCIDTNGHVTSAALLGRVANSRLGEEIAATLRTWTYAPYTKDGAATAACFPLALRTR